MVNLLFQHSRHHKKGHIIFLKKGETHTSLLSSCF